VASFNRSAGRHNSVPADGDCAVISKTLRKGYHVDVEMTSTTLLHVAFCSRDFASRCPIPRWRTSVLPDRAWSEIAAVTGGFFLIDDRSASASHVPTLRDAAEWSAIYPGIAIALSPSRKRCYSASTGVGRAHRIHFYRR
jgi:hypothetical protein